MKQVIEKETTHAFGKDIYLLGTDKLGKKYWLEAPSWDCGWYWGFGYIETYTNNKNPQRAKDIDSHQHLSSFTEKQDNGEFIHNLYDSPVLANPTFTENEGWKLSELFAQFYLLKEMGAFTHTERPGCHVAPSPVDHGNLSELNNKINKVMIPTITRKILEILLPTADKDD